MHFFLLEGPVSLRASARRLRDVLLQYMHLINVISRTSVRNTKHEGRRKLVCLAQGQPCLARPSTFFYLYSVSLEEREASTVLRLL